jgi:hypothetical protein
MGTSKEVRKLAKKMRIAAVSVFAIFAATASFGLVNLAVEASVSSERDVVLSQAVSSNTPKKKKKKVKKTEKPKMIEQTMKSVSQGNWGGEGIRMSVEENSSAIEFACANAEISEKLLMDQSGNFKASGYFIRQGPGPQREGEPKRIAAKFSGAVSGKNMSLKLTFAESGETIGEYTLEQGKNVRIHRCL